ncbi:MAG: sulfurtransferase [bacterium]|nr:sulfurtransferase [bacterium]
MAPLNPLVTTEWLGERLHCENLRIADCRFYLAEPARGQLEYSRSHIPGATYFSLDDDLTGASGPGRHPLPEPSWFVGRLGRAGFGGRHTIVVYDDGSSTGAARMWWMLRSLGHESVFVLDGGWSAWSSEPRSMTSEIPNREPAELALAESWSGTISGDEVETATDLLLIDSRAAARYRGDAEPIDPIAGHIPGAINLPYQSNNGPLGVFQSDGNLGERFDLVVEPRRTVFYCGSGVTACNNILAAAIAGHTDVLLYPGSWSDWCDRGGEVATRKRM